MCLKLPSPTLAVPARIAASRARITDSWMRTSQSSTKELVYLFICQIQYTVCDERLGNVDVRFACKSLFWIRVTLSIRFINTNKKAQLSLTNPRDAKPAKNCSNSTCLQRCRWQYWPNFMRLAAVASEICEIPRNSLKIQTYEVQGHPRSSILVPIESP